MTVRTLKEKDGGADKMRTRTAGECRCLRWYGRTYQDDDRIYFDWTGSGFEVDFKGTLLMAKLHVMPNVLKEPYVDAVTQEAGVRDQTDWPWIAVCLDGEETPSRIFPVRAENQEVLLYYSPVAGRHRIRVVKLSEGALYQTALCALTFDGEISEPDVSFDGTIEFIGDSITCGFGNGVNDPQRRFYASDEDGWMSYAAIASRSLNLDFSIVAISGVTLVPDPVYMPYSFGMKDVYLYTDRLLEERLGRKENFRLWNFSAHPKDIVVMNLGTNDATAIIKSGDPEAERTFIEEYRAFIEKLRALYGKETKIVCSLGSMDYYLYDAILDAVRLYKQETSDERVWTFKYGKMMPETEDVGACMHPTAVLHKKMAAELTVFLKSIL